MTSSIIINLPRHYSDERIHDLLARLRAGQLDPDANMIIEFPAGVTDVEVIKR
jgi:predicted AlkP superfamily phosphohydrolase/phosphomutase